MGQAGPGRAALDFGSVLGFGVRMRIIGGELRRRRILSPPESATTRPIPDMVREAVFNLLRGHTEGQAVLDAFAGTGTIGLEAVSRGASRVVFLERDRRVARLLEQNIADLGVGDRCEVVSGDALGPGAWSRCPKPVHLVFFDPPYALVRDADGWARTKSAFARLVGLLDDEGYAVLRTPWPFVHQGEGGADELVDLAVDGTLGPETHAYGTTAVHLYMRDPGAGGGAG